MVETPTSGSRLALVSLLMSASPDLATLQERLRRFRDEREWSQFHTPKNLAAAIAVEAGELQELFLWANEAGAHAVLDGRGADVEDELADVMIGCLNFADATGIDVLDAVARKIDRNETRYPVERSRGHARKHTEL